MQSDFDEVAELWRLIKREWVRTNMVGVGEGPLLPPVPDDEIKKYEMRFDVRFPEHYRNSLRVTGGVASGVCLWDSVAVVSLSEVAAAWEDELAMASFPSMQGILFEIVNGPVRNAFFDRLWIPVAADNGIPICIDMNPANGGIVGQIIYVAHEFREISVVASSFAEFLRNGLVKMQAEGSPVYPGSAFK